MEAFQKRVVDEKSELDQKISKLGEFIAGPVCDTLPANERVRLHRQHEVMQEYSSILGQRIAAFALLLLLVVGVVGCQTQARVASQNIAIASEQFEVNRRAVFYNGITGNYMLLVEGHLSIHKDNRDHQLEVTVKTGPNQFKKHTLGLSDNISYFCEQLDPVPAGTSHYRMVFRPSTIIPDVELD